MTPNLKLTSLLAILATSGIALAEPASFPSPDAAVAAMVAALEATDRAAVLAIFGPESEDLLSTGDSDQDREVWSAFLKNVKTFQQIEQSGDDRAILYTGRERWPFPVPLVRENDTWHFDPEEGREEILMRRIGLNELAVIDIMTRAGSVQAAFRQRDHDGDGVKEFASSILSTPGKRDGLYWPDEPGSEKSPLGDFMARANDAGYSLDGTDRAPEPYLGYYFRILRAQGPAAAGGAYSYMIGDNMVAGHALLAYPAAYGDSGIMTFTVSEGGIVYQSDLGKDSLSKAAAIVAFDPGEGWTPVE
jgi:hypothetical protein